MARVDAFNRGREAEDDEFYTRLTDIEKELRHYKSYFKGKTVFCNCDDPYESNFFKYFAMNFNVLGLKKLITTCYVTSPVMYTQLSLFDDMEYQIQVPQNPNKKPYKVEITEVTDENGDGAFDLEDIKQLLKSKKNVCKVLKGDGDFRSEECVELLKEADIVVTNPPFSLWTPFVKQLLEHRKSFLIIGRETNTTIKDVFEWFRSNQIWYGYTHATEFYRPNGTTKKFGNVAWFTNLDVEKRHESLILCKSYDPASYPHYYNFDGIDVEDINSIPNDYYGYMGIPSSFLFQFNPEQFELIGLARDSKEVPVDRSIYPQIKKLNSNTRPSHIGYFLPDGMPKEPFGRIIIRRKEQPT